jgi:hypothetical protein
MAFHQTRHRLFVERDITRFFVELVLPPVLLVWILVHAPLKLSRHHRCQQWLTLVATSATAATTPPPPSTRQASSMPSAARATKHTGQRKTFAELPHRLANKSLTCSHTVESPAQFVVSRPCADEATCRQQSPRPAAPATITERGIVA